jgi:hypothetical protein
MQTDLRVQALPFPQAHPRGPRERSVQVSGRNHSGFFA